MKPTRKALRAAHLAHLPASSPPPPTIEPFVDRFPMVRRLKFYNPFLVASDTAWTTAASAYIESVHRRLIERADEGERSTRAATETERARYQAAISEWQQLLRIDRDLDTVHGGAPEYKRQRLRRLGMPIGSGSILTFGNVLDLYFPELISIGGGTTVGMGSAVLAHEFVDGKLRVGPVHIGRNCLIAFGTLILPGVTIGDDAIVGPGLIAGNVPVGSYVLGMEARVERQLERSEADANANDGARNNGTRRRRLASPEYGVGDMIVGIGQSVAAAVKRAQRERASDPDDEHERADKDEDEGEDGEEDEDDDPLPDRVHDDHSDSGSGTDVRGDDPNDEAERSVNRRGRRVDEHPHDLSEWYRIRNPLTLLANTINLGLLRATKTPNWLRVQLLRQLGVTVGADVHIAADVTFDYWFPERIRLGDRCRINTQTALLTHEGLIGKLRVGDLSIGIDTAIEPGCGLLPGIRVGDHAQVMPYTFVTRDVPAGAVVRGIPARVVDSDG